MAKSIKVIDVSSTDAVNEAEEVEQVESVKQEEAVSETKPEAEPESEKRILKTVELIECEKCGKKLTARTLKYSHSSKCPNGDGKPQQVQIPKPVKPEKKRAELEPEPILTAYEQRMLRIRERQDKIRQLASQAFQNVFQIYITSCKVQETMKGTRGRSLEVRRTATTESTFTTTNICKNC